MNLINVLVDFAIFSGLMITGQIIRSKISLLQNWKIPATLIGGFLAIVFGANGFDLLPLSDMITQYPEILVVFIFACLPFNKTSFKSKHIGRDVGEMYAHVTFGIFAQYGWGMMMALLFLAPLWNLNPSFGFVLGIGFWGGPGTTAAAAAGFSALQGEEILSLGLTAWMIGVLCSVVVGTFMINYFSNKTAAKIESQSESSEVKISPSGFIPEKYRKPLGMETLSSQTMDSLTLHFSIALIIVIIGLAGNRYLKVLWPDISIPAFGIALIFGFILVFLLERFKFDKKLDYRTFSRINGTATDYLIVVGMACIQLPTIIKYAFPFFILMIFGVLLSVFQAVILGPAMFKKYWLEKSLLVFGMNTGTLAQGIMLVRMNDPEMKSNSLSIYGIVDLLIKPITIGIIVIGPILISSGYVFHFGIACTILAFIPLIIMLRAGFWNKKASLRENLNQIKK